MTDAIDNSDSGELEAVKEAEAPSDPVAIAVVPAAGAKVGVVGGFDITSPVQEPMAAVSGTVPIEQIKLDLVTLEGQLQTLVVAAIQKLLNDASVDVSTYVPYIGADMVEAIKTGDSALQAELTNQLKAVAELSRLRTNTELKGLFTTASGLIVDVATEAAQLALQAALGKVGSVLNQVQV